MKMKKKSHPLKEVEHIFFDSAQGYTVAGTITWLEGLQKKCQRQFAELGTCLGNTHGHLPDELMRTDTKHWDGSWTPIFRILRPERIGGVVWVIKHMKFDTDEDVADASEIHAAIKPIIEGWIALIDQFGEYYSDPTIAERLRKKFKHLTACCKLLILESDRITSGDVLNEAAYLAAFYDFVDYYESLPRVSCEPDKSDVLVKKVLKALKKNAAGNAKPKKRKRRMSQERLEIVRAALAFLNKRRKEANEKGEEIGHQLNIIRQFYNKHWEPRWFGADGKRLGHFDPQDSDNGKNGAIEMLNRCVSAEDRRETAMMNNEEE